MEGLATAVSRRLRPDPKVVSRRQTRRQTCSSRTTRRRMPESFVTEQTLKKNATRLHLILLRSQVLRASASKSKVLRSRAGSTGNPGKIQKSHRSGRQCFRGTSTRLSPHPALPHTLPLSAAGHATLTAQDLPCDPRRTFPAACHRWSLHDGNVSGQDEHACGLFVFGYSSAPASGHHAPGTCARVHQWITGTRSCLAL